MKRSLAKRLAALESQVAPQAKIHFWIKFESAPGSTPVRATYTDYGSDQTWVWLRQGHESLEEFKKSVVDDLKGRGVEIAGPIFLHDDLEEQPGPEDRTEEPTPLAQGHGPSLE